MPWSGDVITQLEAESVGTLNTNIFTTNRASIPVLASGAATLQVTFTGGTSPESTQNSVRPVFRKPGAQFMARASTPAAAEAMAEAAYVAMTKVNNQFINSGWYRRIRALQEPFEMPVDDRKQSCYTFNVIADYNRRD